MNNHYGWSPGLGGVRVRQGRKNRSHKTCHYEGLWLLFHRVKPVEAWSRGLA